MLLAARTYSAFRADRARAAVNFSGTIDFRLRSTAPRATSSAGISPEADLGAAMTGRSPEHHTPDVSSTPGRRGRRPRRKTFLFLFSRRLSLRVCVRRDEPGRCAGSEERFLHNHALLKIFMGNLAKRTSRDAAPEKIKAEQPKGCSDGIFRISKRFNRKHTIR